MEIKTENEHSMSDDHKMRLFRSKRAFLFALAARINARLKRAAWQAYLLTGAIPDKILEELWASAPETLTSCVEEDTLDLMLAYFGVDPKALTERFERGRESGLAHCLEADFERLSDSEPFLSELMARLEAVESAVAAPPSLAGAKGNGAVAGPLFGKKEI